MRYLIFSALLIAFNCSKAQLVSGNAYVKGNYVEFAIDDSLGCEGAEWGLFTPPVAGMHYRANNSFFGIVANPQMDGWVNYNGDYFVSFRFNRKRFWINCTR